MQKFIMIIDSNEVPIQLGALAQGTSFSILAIIRYGALLQQAKNIFNSLNDA